MSLYPSLEDMVVDNMMRAQLAQQQHAPPPSYGQYPTANHHPTHSPMMNNYPTNSPYPMASNYPTRSLPPPHVPLNSAQMYPALGDYMGLELSNDVIAVNMPEYQVQQVQSGGAITNLVAPLSSQSLTLQKATVTQAIRQVVLCKDKDGKCGLRLHSVNNGVFVCFVAAGSPAAMAGLRFGDQILEINGIALAGKSMDDCHGMLRKGPINGIMMSVRDRPFERTVTLHKDSLGHVGFQFKDGNIIAIVKDSSAARNGLLTDHQILEINTINVVGMKDKEVSKVIENANRIVNLTIIPNYIYKHMISKMSSSLFKELDRTPAV